MAVARDIAEAMNDPQCDTDHPLVVVKSTVPVGTTYKVRDQIAALTDHPFSVADNPEFLKEGDAIADFQKPDRIVCGIHDVKWAGNGSRDSTTRSSGRSTSCSWRSRPPRWSSTHPTPCWRRRSPSSMKWPDSASTMARTSIGCEGMRADRRIGREFLIPDWATEEILYPKTRSRSSRWWRLNIYSLLNQAVHDVNQAQRPWFINRIVRHFNNDMKGVHVAVWGLAFKPNTDDVREAPAHTIISGLLDAGATVTAFDPIARDTFAKYGLDIKIVDDMYQALPGADALDRLHRMAGIQSTGFRPDQVDPEVAARLRRSQHLGSRPR